MLVGWHRTGLGDVSEALRCHLGWVGGCGVPVGPCRGLQVPSGPQRYAEAAHTFEELLLQDGSYVEAATQLEACRAQLQVRPPSPNPLAPSSVLLCPPRLTPVPSQQCSRPGGVPVSPFLLKATEPLSLPGKGQG